MINYVSPWIATDWLCLAIVLCLFSWMAARRLTAILLPFAVVIAAIAVWLPTGSPRLTAVPPGKYTVLGAKIEVDVAIWALLDDGKGEPRYFRLPYSASAANKLQNALDGAENGSGVKAQVGQDGGVAYSGDPPVTGVEQKPVETPEYQP